jgi:uncharacterized protein YkwD
MSGQEKVRLEYCPNCKLRSLFYNQTMQIWECLNPKCRRIYTSDKFSEYRYNQQSNQSTPRQAIRKRRTQQISFDAPLWLVNILESKRAWSLLICLAVSWWCWMGIQYSASSFGQAIGIAFPILLLFIIKLVLRKYLNNYKNLAMQHNISPLFYSLRKSPLLRLGIILMTITLLATTIWSIYSFISNLTQSASLIYLLNMAVLIAAQIWVLNWLCKTLRHSRYISRKPKFAAIFWPLLAGLILCAFVGVHPLSDIKDSAKASITDWWGQTSIATKPPAEPPAESPPSSSPSNSTPEITNPRPVIDIPKLEMEIHSLINTERQRNNLPSLGYDTKLAEIARNHSLDMATHNYFDHYNSSGQGPTERAKAAGYNCYKNFGSYYTDGIAENILQDWLYSSTTYYGGIATHDWNTQEELANSAVNGWMGSPGHRQNILNPNYSREGIGVAISSDDKVLITQDFW